MNILFTTYQGHNEGSTQSIMFLCKGLSERGHTIYLGCRKESHIYEKMKNSSVELIPMTFSGKMDRQNIRHIRDVVKDKKIDLINAQASKDRYTTIFAKWFYKLDVKLIHTRRQKPESTGLWIQNWLYSTKTDQIIAVSEGVKKGLVALGLPSDHIHVIYNGTPQGKYQHISASKTEALRSKYNLTQEDRIIGCVSRKKKQEQILLALAKISFPVKMIFIGIEEPENFEEVKQTYSVPHQIFFEGTIPPEEVLNYYQIFDLKILASTMEGLSQSILESMAMGVPVIATAASGNLDLIEDRKNGLLFPDGDIDLLGELITYVFSDKEIRQTLIEEGKKTALEDFNIENTINHYETFFKGIISR